MQIKKNNSLLENARALRREMTPQERKLWYGFMQHHPVKIYKQRIIDDFIVDFYCASARLVIELDGYYHFTDAGKAYDKARGKSLEKYDLMILRFSDNEVDRSFKKVCDTIDKVIHARMGNV